VKVDTAEGANGNSSGALRDRRRSGMNSAFAVWPPSILADSITTPICVHETTKLNRLIHSDGLATETGGSGPSFVFRRLDDEVHANSRHATDHRSLSGISKAALLKCPGRPEPWGCKVKVGVPLGDGTLSEIELKNGLATQLLCLGAQSLLAAQRLSRGSSPIRNSLPPRGSR
jgi:hypothetical protein